MERQWEHSRKAVPYLRLTWPRAGRTRGSPARASTPACGTCGVVRPPGAAAERLKMIAAQTLMIQKGKQASHRRSTETSLSTCISHRCTTCTSRSSACRAAHALTASPPPGLLSCAGRGPRGRRAAGRARSAGGTAGCRRGSAARPPGRSRRSGAGRAPAAGPARAAACVQGRS
eukprot:SAG22_NODE_864_length_6788_cov_2.700553_7_plen_174_part_00